MMSKNCTSVFFITAYATEKYKRNQKDMGLLLSSKEGLGNTFLLLNVYEVYPLVRMINTTY